MTSTDQDRDDIALAGEYALGLLEGAERDAFEARLATDARLAGLVASWQSDLARLAEEVAPVAPPDRLKAAIETRLFGAPSHPVRVLASGRRGWMAAAGLALAAGLAVLALLDGFTTPAPARLVAEVAAEDRSLIVSATAELRGEDGEMVARLVSGGPPPDRVFELWLIPGGADRPVSLGVIAPDRPTRIALPEALVAGLAGATLAISTEPPGGSPTGQPTGPVVAAGQIVRPG